MRENIVLTGMVLKTAPVREYDKRLVILTGERGKVTAFAKGIKKPGSHLMAFAEPFVYAKFTLAPGRDAYTLIGAEAGNYFREIASDFEAACYGFYFLELADYYGCENIEARETVRLLYMSLLALLKPSIPDRLVKAVFELKLMQLNGEYTEEPGGRLPGKAVSGAARQAWEHVLKSPPGRLYNFTLSGGALAEFSDCVDQNRRRFIEVKFSSLDMLNAQGL